MSLTISHIRQHDPRKKTIHATFDIKDYVRTFRKSLSERLGRRVIVRTEDEAMSLKSMLNDPENTRWKSMTNLLTGRPGWDGQKVMCYPSNLGLNMGYIFYFI